MNRAIFSASLLSLAFMAAPQAFADNIANCELVLMETIETEDGHSSAQVASYRPAADFIASVYNDDTDTLSDIDGLAIRALLCSRNNVIISETDFKLLATGVPFILSQNFDSPDTDLLTYFFKEGKFHYTHKGDGLSEDELETLTTRMADFNTRETEIETLVSARETKSAAAETEAPNEEISEDETLMRETSAEDTSDTKNTETQSSEIVTAKDLTDTVVENSNGATDEN